MYLNERNWLLNQFYPIETFRKRSLIPKKKMFQRLTRIIPSEPKIFRSSRIEHDRESLASSIYATDDVDHGLDFSGLIPLKGSFYKTSASARKRTSSIHNKSAKNIVLEPAILQLARKETRVFQGFSNSKLTKPKALRTMTYYSRDKPISISQGRFSLQPIMVQSYSNQEAERYNLPIPSRYPKGNDFIFMGPSLIPSQYNTNSSNPYPNSMMPYYLPSRYMYPQQFFSPNQMFLPMGYPAPVAPKYNLPPQQSCPPGNCVVLEGNILHPPNCFIENDCRIPPAPLWNLHCYRKDVKPPAARSASPRGKEAATSEYMIMKSRRSSKSRPKKSLRHQYSLLDQDENPEDQMEELEVDEEELKTEYSYK